MPELVQSYPSVFCNFHKKRHHERGDVLIRGLWERGTDCIIDIRATDIDAKSNLNRYPTKVLVSHEKRKRRNTLSHASTDGLLGEEAKTLLKKLPTINSKMGEVVHGSSWLC
jgi:hypothetical protein